MTTLLLSQLVDMEMRFNLEEGTTAKEELHEGALNPPSFDMLGNLSPRKYPLKVGVAGEVPPWVQDDNNNSVDHQLLQQWSPKFRI